LSGIFIFSEIIPLPTSRQLLITGRLGAKPAQWLFVPERVAERRLMTTTTMQETACFILVVYLDLSTSLNSLAPVFHEGLKG
jgi:hypothetical protein